MTDGRNKSLCYHFKLQSGSPMPNMLQFIKINGQALAFSYGYLYLWQLANKEKLVISYGNERIEIKGFNLDALCPHLSNHTLLWLREVKLGPETIDKQAQKTDVLITSIECLVNGVPSS